MTTRSSCPYCGRPLAAYKGQGRHATTCGGKRCLLAARLATKRRERFCDGCGASGLQLRASGRAIKLYLCPPCYELDAPARDPEPAAAAPAMPPPASSSSSGCGPEPTCRRGHWCATCRHASRERTTLASHARAVRLEAAHS